MNLTNLLRFFKKEKTENNDMNNLIVGLGNIGDEYDGTRHNMGFRILDALAGASNISFEDKRYGFIAEMRIKNQNVILLKPSTYMNASGNAVRYWMDKKNIDLSRLLIISDDLALPFGTIRMKPGGSEGGHNGLRSITSCIGTNQYARLRFGIGNDFSRGGQVNFVLGGFSQDELAKMDERVETATKAIQAFVLSGIQFAMNQYNGK